MVGETQPLRSCMCRFLLLLAFLLYASFGRRLQPNFHSESDESFQLRPLAELLLAQMPLRSFGLHDLHGVSSSKVNIPMMSIPSRKWVIGLNKYSHDAGCTLLPADDSSSDAIFTVPKERISRKKHDGGDVASSVRHALDSVGASLDDVVVVCANDHHHRIAPFERRLPWSVSLGHYEDSNLSPDNLLPNVPSFEMSHHLAHAWSAISQAPFENGLVVVMDGMGETLMAMEEAAAAGETTYFTDLQLEKHPSFQSVPANIKNQPPGYREAETVYSFEGRQVRRVFKRWVPLRSPSELFNHGFENLESMGALYSRISSHIFGDWNVCGKVMGLGPWVQRWVPDVAHGADFLEHPFLRGEIDGTTPDTALQIDWPKLESLPDPNGFKALLHDAGENIMAEDGGISDDLKKRRGFYTALAARVQTDLEETTLSFLRRMRERTNEKNLIFVGGVAQNSVLNGRIAREAGFEQVFIPPFPGDEGIPVGCAAFAQQILLPKLGFPSPPVQNRPWSAFQGKEYSDTDIQEAVEDFEPWLEEVLLEKSNDDSVLLYAAKALADGEIIGWVDGRAEVGARALGHRSILADPSREDMHRRANIVKQREQFRPLAPSVLAEEVDKWFDGVPKSGSPYMQFTASVRPELRKKVPAITHVDGSSRLQTVSKEDAPEYHALIAAFASLSGIPMVLDTSFNLAGMPIVESPSDVISCFLDADPDLSLLVLFGRVYRRRKFPHSLKGIPKQESSFVSRSVSGPSGEVLRNAVLVDGKELTLTDDLELELLELCAAGDNNIGDLLSSVQEADDSVTEADVLERLRHLYDLRLISF